MAKNKNGLEKDKKKKLPFNVLSKKGLAALALAGVMIASPLMLAGCSGEQGPKGNDGTNGSTWYSGTEYSASQGVVGDFFFDIDDYDIYTKTADGWTWLSNIKGATGPEGPAGNDGQNGQDGITPTITINEDGYWVINGVPTTTKAQGPAGENGQNGTTPTISINDEGYWVINGEPTDVKAEAINGTNGEDGNTWSVGAEYPTTPNNGDMFLNNTTWEVYQYNGTEWVSKGNIKGQDGQNGTNGQDGVNCYLGYDGYIWNGAERTEFSVNANLGENVVENTIGIEGVMSKYFAGSYIDLSNNTVALMANYMPNAKFTQYSGTNVTQIKVIAEEAGNLYIGTAKVADIVNARTTGTTYTSSTTAYEVTAGLNTITLNLNVAEDETIVLGGQGSVGLYMTSNIPVEDEHGNFTLVDGTSHTEVVSKTSNVQDTLAIQVSAVVLGENTQLVTGFEKLENLTASDPNLNDTHNVLQPFIFADTSYFENAQISKIKLFLTGTIFDNDDSNVNDPEIDDDTEYIYEFHIIDSASVVANSIPTIKRTYQIKVKGKDVVKKAWNTFDVSSLGIYVEEGETLGFGSANSTLENYYYTSSLSSSLNYYGNTSSTDQKLKLRTTMSLLVGVEGIKDSNISFEEHLQTLRNKEEEANSKNF